LDISYPISFVVYHDGDQYRLSSILLIVKASTLKRMSVGLNVPEEEMIIIETMRGDVTQKENTKES